MTDLAQFIARSAVATPSVAIGLLVSTIREVSSEISRRTRGAGIVNETEIWNSLLGAACDDAEQEVAIKYRTEALNNVSALPDLAAVRAFDIVVARDSMFAMAQAEFQMKCTDARADLLQLIPVLIAGAEQRIRQAIEGHLHGYLTELSDILSRQEEVLQISQQEATNVINGLTEKALPDFNLIGSRRTLARRMSELFLSRVSRVEDAEPHFSERIRECTAEIREFVEEHLHLRYAVRMKEWFSANLQETVRELFPVGTILAIIGDAKPAWMAEGGAKWERIEQGRVLVSSGPGASGFPAGARGGQGEHNHYTQSHVLAVHEMPSHAHGGSNEEVWCEGHGGFHWGGSGHTVRTSTHGVVGGNQGHDHGPTTVSSSYPPYLCATFWRRIG
jgi:hypothetical protein